MAGRRIAALPKRVHTDCLRPKMRLERRTNPPARRLECDRILLFCIYYPLLSVIFLWSCFAVGDHLRNGKG